MVGALQFSPMSYNQYDPDGPRGPAPRPQYGYEAPPNSQRRRGDTANVVARVVSVISIVVAVIFALHVFFSLANANQGNGFVQFIYGLAKVLVLGFGDVFTPDDAKIGLVLNYGLAAIIYLVVGHLIVRALRR